MSEVELSKDLKKLDISVPFISSELTFILVVWFCCEALNLKSPMAQENLH